MITFYIANSIEEAEFNDNALNFPEEVHSYLIRNEEKFPFDLKTLVNLSPYREINILDSQKIYEIIELSDNMIQHTWGNNLQLNVFFLSLLKFCNKAIEEDKFIVAIGD